MAEGMRKGLTSYGDPEFSLFLRKAFIMVGIVEFAGGILAGAGLMLAHREGLVGAVTFSYFSLALSFRIFCQHSSMLAAGQPGVCVCLLF